jgi:hypothetical protein
LWMSHWVVNTSLPLYVTIGKQDRQ